MTWHYIFEKTNPRLVKYQRLTAHPHAATVEDQFELGKQSIRSVATGTQGLIGWIARLAGGNAGNSMDERIKSFLADALAGC
jgi:hypothetical protein